MPTYEYACTNCGNLWEAVQRISENALDTCPKCGLKTAQRQISGGGAFILKGGGWYSDLYSSSKPKASSPSTTDAKPSTDAAKPAAAESKPSESSTKSDSGPKPSGGDGGGSTPSKPAAA